MSVPIRFFTSSLGTPNSQSQDKSWTAFGSLMTSDVQGVAITLMDLLDAVDSVRAGRSGSEPIGGNSWDGTVDTKGLHLQDMHSDDWTGSYTREEPHEGMHARWDHLSPSTDAKLADVQEWEELANRNHPCRSDLTDAP